MSIYQLTKLNKFNEAIILAFELNQINLAKELIKAKVLFLKNQSIL